MTERRLPVKQLVILSICRFAEPIALTSVFPYLPEMIESFGVPQNDIARWAGLISSVFSACQCLTGIPWGAASDRYGRKTVILIGLCNTMGCAILWGFSTSLPMAFATRALQGAGNGNVGILRTMVAELCPWKELQPRAFSIMPLVFTLGAVFGPLIGGALSNPLHVDPRKPRGTKFLEKYPYALPNLTVALLFLIGIITGFLFLKETLESKKHQRDIGLVLGNQLMAFFRRIGRVLSRNSKTNREREPLLSTKSSAAANRRANDEESISQNHHSISIPEPPKPTYRDVLTTQTSLNLLVYALLALYTIAFDQLIPVFLHHPVQDRNSPDFSLPFKFASGYGVDSREIGIIFTAYSVGATFSQLVLFPPIARKVGVLRCLRTAFLMFPIIFLLIPFTALLPTPASRFGVMAVLMVLRGVAGTFAFPTSTILLTNSASSLRTLGTLNGIATSASAIGRAVGPAIGGGVFTMGVKHGYIIAPFWILTAISLLAAIPTFFLIEGEGFGEDGDVEEDEDAILAIDDDDDKSDEETVDNESEYGALGDLLSHTPSRISTVVATDDEFSDEEEARVSRIRSSSTSHNPRSRSLRRRSSVPIGMGVGFRRYSSNLGSTGLPEGSWGA